MNSRHLLTRLLALITSSVVAFAGISPVANAGPGYAPGHSRNANPAGPPDVVEQTFYANSPLGLRPDPLGGPNSPQINTGTAMRKFVDTLPSIPGLAPTTTAGTGTVTIGGRADTKIIPLAVAGKWPADNADYYHLAIVEYTENMHSDLPKATTLRGYVQIEEPGIDATSLGSKHVPLLYPSGAPIQLPDAAGTLQNVFGYDKPHYLGPAIVATKDVPTRIKYSNLLPPGAASATARNGDLFIPVDATLAGGALPQNRIAIHLHGGLSPWISDGTPHQWTLPVGDTRYGSVTDMAVVAVGAGYTSAPTVKIAPPQAVASGFAASVANGTVTAINVANRGANYTTATAAPTIGAPMTASAATAGAIVMGAGGTLQTIAVNSGGGYYSTVPAVTVGAPPAGVTQTGTATISTATHTVTGLTLGARVIGYAAAPTVTFAAPTGTVTAATWSLAALTPSATTGALSTTAATVSNGGLGYWTAPTVTVTAPAAAVGLTGTTTLSPTGAVATLNLTNTASTWGYGNMASVTGLALTAPGGTATTAIITTNQRNAVNFRTAGAKTLYFTNTGAAGGTSTPSGAGYNITGFLPTLTVFGATGSLTVTGTTTSATGQLLSLSFTVNTAYSANPTAVMVGAPPAKTTATVTLTVAGNRVTGATLVNVGSGYTTAPSLASLAQPPVSVTATGTATINAATGVLTGVSVTGGRNYAAAPTVTVAAPVGNVAATGTATFVNTSFAAIPGAVPTGRTGAIIINTILPGSGYTTAPLATLSGGTGGAATVTAVTLNGAGVRSVTINFTRAYTRAPTLTIASPPANGYVSGVTITKGGMGYTSVPTVTFSSSTQQASATAVVVNGAVTSFAITNPGLGYGTAPAVTVAAPPASVQAAATAVVDVNGQILGFRITNPGYGYATAPTVTVGWPAGAVQATATATVAGGALSGVSIGIAGAGYSATPSVTLSGGAGSGGMINVLISTPVGASFRQVPDMVGAGVGPTGYTSPIVGEGTLYYTNAQSARLMWYHDHAAGTTRLNAYAGMASPYLIRDPLIDPALAIPLPGSHPAASSLEGYVPEEIIPLVIQDKTFVPQDIALEDARWDTAHWGQPGDLWFPHVYETNQNPAMLASASAAGRWDWGPWFAIVYPSMYALPSGSYGDATTTPEAFHDTMVVNGVAFPTLTVEPRAYRFMVLNGANDRFMNLGFYTADPLQARAGDGAINVEVTAGPNSGDQPGRWPGNTFSNTPALKGLTPWPTDGRWAPLPSEMGPPMIQIGTEGGILPMWVQQDPIPLSYDYNRRSVTVLNVSQDNDVTQRCYPKCHGLYLGAAMRADVVVDFAPFAGQTLILYNDAPSPNPGFDPRIDYFTGNDPGNTGNYATGGAPNTMAGYGPNTRTVMQVVVGKTTLVAKDYSSALNPDGSYNPAALGAGMVVGQLVGTPGLIQQLYAATQPAPIVGESAYNVVGQADATHTFSTNYTDQFGDMYLGSQNEPMFFVTNPGPLTITGIMVTGQTTATGAASGVGPGAGSTGTNPTAGSGTGYLTAPAVRIAPPNCTSYSGRTCAPATATATVTAGQVTSITLTDPGYGYTEVPAVTLVPGGTLAAVTITNSGSGYTTVPAVTITGGGGSGATATATVTGGAVTGVTLAGSGTGYTSAPIVTIAPPATIAASGNATLVSGSVSAVSIANGGAYPLTFVPTVTFSAPPAAVQGTPATATGTLLASYCCTFVINNGGSGYTTAPVVTVTTATAPAIPVDAIATVSNGAVIGISLNSGSSNGQGGLGSGYTTGVTVSIAAPPTVAAGTTASATPVMASTGTYDYVASLTVAGGSGYNSAPTITFSGGVPATATASVAGSGTGATAAAIGTTTMAFVVPAALPNSGVPIATAAPPVTLPGVPCAAGQVPCPTLQSMAVGRLMNPAIQELFEPFYGRMNSTLGIEMPNQSLAVQTTLPLNYVDPATELFEAGSAQLWKITHNGVDAHPVHFHLVNVQVVNRVGWDGTVKPVEDAELGWRETVIMNPLEDIIIAMRAVMPQVPFGLDRSFRPQDPSQPLGVNMGFTQFAIVGLNGNATNGQPVPAGALGIGEPLAAVNSMEDYDNEYVWHCHILGHEENDMMRAIVASVATSIPDAPGALAVSQAGSTVVATWVDPTPLCAAGKTCIDAAGVSTYGNPKNELGFVLERSTDQANWFLVTTTAANAQSAIDQVPGAVGTTVYYRVHAFNKDTVGKLIGGTNTGIGAYSTIASLLLK